VANTLNASTAIGLLVARLGGATVRPGPQGTLLAHGYRWRFPPAGAFTVGDVVLTRRPEGYLGGRPALLGHELRHTTQYAWCLGLPMLPAYLAAAGWSWLRTGDPASRNVFERRAGLAAGGYRERQVISLAARLRHARDEA
jgi:hypothetical protein